MLNYNQTLQTNNSSLEEIITQLNKLPDGGNIDTCTLILNFDAYCRVFQIVYSHLNEANKIITTALNYDGTKGSRIVNLENIVCGSFLYISWTGASEAVGDIGFATPIPDDTGCINYDRWQVPSTSGLINNIYFLGAD